MFNFLDSLITYLEANLTLPTIIKLSGTLEGTTKKAITIRLIPGMPGNSYIKGRNEGVSFQVLVKDPSEVTAIQTITNIARAIEGADRTVYGSLIRCSIYVTPNFVEKASTDEYIYTALFQAELEGVA